MSSHGYSSIFITGASSGLGYSLALEFAEHGVFIGIAARRIDRLIKLKKEIEKRGGQAFLYELDVTNLKAMRRAAKDFTKKVGEVDLVIANAGTGSKVIAGVYKTEELARVMDINIQGVVYTLNEFLADMILQKAGHLVAISSVAAFAALPTGSYSATKIAVRYMMDIWRNKHWGSGVSFTTIHPGFVETELTGKNKFSMPFIIKSDKAALLMRRAIVKKKKSYIYPWQWRFIVPILKRLPGRILAMGSKKVKK